MWYYVESGAQAGPVSADELRQRIATGQTARETLVWREGMFAWAPAMSLPEFAAIVGPMPVSPLGYQVPYHLAPGAGPLYGGFWLRLAAAIIDTLVLLIPNLLISVLVELGFTGKITFDSGGAEVDAVDHLITLVVDWLYYTLMECSSRQATLGKMACGLKVTDLAGNPITFGRATGRYFGKIISMLALFIGFMMAGWTQKKQCLHDIMAGTLVIKK